MVPSCASVIGGACQPLSKSMSFDLGNCSGVSVRTKILDGRIAAWPTKMASWRLSPESIFVRPAIESGSIARTCSRSASFVIRRMIQLLHCDSTVASTSLGRCDTKRSPNPYFRPSFAIRRIASWAASSLGIEEVPFLIRSLSFYKLSWFSTVSIVNIYNWYQLGLLAQYKYSI